MFWFNGSIKSAVDNVNSSGIPLLIFIKGDDELSNAYDHFLSSNKKLDSKEFIALKIYTTSDAFQQFKEIYCSVPVPSIFFINNNGIPIKIISSKNTNDISNEINDILKNGIQITNNKKKVKEEQEVENTNVNNLEKKNQLAIENDEKTVKGIITKSSYARNVARIQFRLPNNSLPSWEFPDLSTLADVRAYLMEKTDLPPNFKLLQACPRRGFTPQDEQKTLVDLSLTPNAILIVIPVQDKTVQARVKNIVAKRNIALLVLETLLQPFLIFIKYFKKHVLKIENDSTTTEPSRMPSDMSMGKTLNKTTSTSNTNDFDQGDDCQNEFGHIENYTRYFSKKNLFCFLNCNMRWQIH